MTGTNTNRRYLYASLIFFAVASMKLLLFNFFQPMPLVFLTLVVLYCCWFFGKGPGILTAMLSSILSAYILLTDGTNSTVTLQVLRVVTATFSFYLMVWLVEHIKQAGESRAAWTESQREILTILESLDQGYATVCFDESFKIHTWGAGAEKMTGYIASEAIGHTIHKFFSEEDIRKDIPEAIIQSIKTNSVWNSEIRAVRKNGSRFWVNVTTFRLPIGFMVLARDITQEKHKEESFHKWQHIFEHGGWSACVMDVKTNTFTHVNPAFTRMHGYAHPDELIGKPMAMVFAPEFLDNLPGLLQAVYSSKSDDYNCDTTHIRKDGVRFPVHTHVSVFRDDEDIPIYRVAICQDITQERKIQRQLRRTTEELRDAAENKDNFLATLAHELRNPLQPIKTALHLYHESGVADLKLLDLIERNIDQIEHHVDDLLDIARISKGKIELQKASLDLRDVIHLAVEQVHPRIRAKGQKLYISVPTNPVVLNGDPTRIQQIVTNLLHNAHKFTDEQGSIWITVESMEGHAIVRVRDSGVGIDKELLPKIFDLYSQGTGNNVTKRGSGLGIGLTLVKTFVDLHQGKVSVESEAGKGTTFTVLLPVGEEAKVEDPLLPVSNKIFNGNTTGANKKILVVDDNADAATSLQMMFAMEGCDVVVANDGEEAIKTYEGFHPDIIICDIGLPKIDGYEVARRIRAINEKITLIAITGYGQPSDKKRSSEAGFDAHVVKPVEPCRFKQLVNDTFEARINGVINV